MPTAALAFLRESPTALDGAVATLLNDIAASTEDIVLVLDDYHAIESVEVHESMRFLVEHLPPQLHLVVASRADPPWPLATLRARDDLLELRAADLRFTAEEAAEYLNDAMGLDLTRTDVETLEGRTEGWIAALQLAALSLRGRDDSSTFIAGFAGDDRFVVDYLVDEVLDRQPDDVRRFLVETSILSRMTADLCTAVTGDAEAKTTLASLERSNLFLVALDDRRQWYRYHHLFADVLRSRLADASREHVADLHRRASDWFATNGDRADAIGHALAGEDFARAAELIELAVPSLRLARQEATLRTWLEALPPEIFASRPVLSIGLVGARMSTGDIQGVEELLDVVERLLAPEQHNDDVIVFDQLELDRLPAQAAMYRAGLALLRGDLAQTVEHGERAARIAADDDHLASGAAAALIGLARWAGGDLDAAQRRYTDAIAAFERAGHLADILGCSLGLADIQVGQGRLDAAQRTLTRALDVAIASAPLRGTADMHVGLGELLLERNDLVGAAEQLRASRAVGDHLALPQHAYRSRVLDARLRAAHGDHAGALALLVEAEGLYETDYSPRVRPAAATTVRQRLATGDLDAAMHWVADADVAADDEPSYLREYEHLTLARVLLATGGTDQAIALLQRLVDAADAGGRAGSAVEAVMLLALAHRASDDTARALTTIEDALTRAATVGYVRMFLDAGTPMTALLDAAVRHGRTPELAQSILAAGTRAERSPMHPDLVDPLSPRELDVLRLLRTELTWPEIAAELVVSLNTVRSHTKSIFSKLGVSNRRAAVRRAGELGL